MNHPAIRALVDEANTLVGGADHPGEGTDSWDCERPVGRRVRAFVTFIRLKGERYQEAKSHPGEGGPSGTRRVSGSLKGR